MHKKNKGNLQLTFRNDKEKISILYVSKNKHKNTDTIFFIYRTFSAVCVLAIWISINCLVVYMGWFILIEKRGVQPEVQSPNFSVRSLGLKRLYISNKIDLLVEK